MAMPILIKGFAFYFGDEVSATDASFNHFFSWIQEFNPETQWPYLQDSRTDFRRRLYFAANENHWYGVFISARATEFQHFMRREGARVIVEARSVSGDPPIEMNFFCMRKDSRKGIFSHYRGSYSFRIFIRDLWNCYRSFVVLKKESRLNNMGPADSEERTKREYSIHSKAKSGPLFTPGSFDQLLGRLATIDELRVTAYEVDSPADEPVSGKIRNVHKIYRFQSSEIVDSRLRQWIKSARNSSAKLLTSRRTAYSGSVLGAEENGAPISLSFENTMEDYLGFDYDEIGTFELTNLFGHQLIQSMVTRMSHGILFSPQRR
jgi:hypothetical protein